VRHGKDAIPPRRGFVKEIVLATLPVSARGAVVRPFVQAGLKGFLRVFPTAVPVEFASLLEEIEARTNFVRRSVNRILSDAADEFVEGDRLEFALYADEIEFTEDEAILLSRRVGCLVD